MKAITIQSENISPRDRAEAWFIEGQHARNKNSAIPEKRPSKAERAKPKPVLEPGEFVWIEKEDLKVDHTYQRDHINQARIDDMAANWDWVFCGALSVAIRNNEWWVIDGQHRKLAADRRDEIKKLPCLVFKLESQQLEAGAFVALNSRKTAVGGFDRFKAMVVAGDKSAIETQKIIESTGHKLSFSSGHKSVACVILLWRLYRRDGGERLRRIWPLIADMSAGSSIYDTLVRAIYGAEVVANKQDLTLTGEPYRSGLIKFTGAALTAEINREINIAGKGGERIETAATVKWLNRQRFGSKFKLPVVV